MVTGYRVHDTREDTESLEREALTSTPLGVTESTIRERILKADPRGRALLWPSGYRVHDPREDTESGLGHARTGQCGFGYRVHDPREDTESIFSTVALGWASVVTESTIRERILKEQRMADQLGKSTGYRVHDPREDTERTVGHRQ